MTGSRRWAGVAATAVVALLAAGCGSTGPVVSGSGVMATTAAPSSTEVAAPVDATGRLTAPLTFADGALLVDPAPPGDVPASSADDALRGARIAGEHPGHVPQVFFGLGTTPGSGQGKPGGGISPMVDHQLVWIVWYPDIDILPHTACCDAGATGPVPGESVTIVDAATGQAITTFSSGR